MSKKKRNPIEDGGIPIDSPFKLTVKKPNFSSTEFGPHQNKLFDSISLDNETSPYNIVTPGVSQFDKTVKSTSPALLAIGAKAQKTRSALGPSLIKPTLNGSRAPIGQDFNSLLTKKPLSDLPNPNKTTASPFVRQNEIEKMGLAFKDDPIAYFSKHKDGRGHKFIYLKYAKSRNDPYFSPYELMKVPFCEAGEDYFTMSANGVTHIDEQGNTEYCSLDAWAKEETDFCSISKLRLFQTYLFWKPFKFWRTYVMRQRYKSTTRTIKHHPSICNKSFALTAVSISALLHKSDKIMDDNLLALIPQRKYTIREYEKLCNDNINNLKKQYKEFLKSVIGQFSALYAKLCDPQNLIVSESDFDEIKRKNPNLTALIQLEKKKEERRQKKSEKMKCEKSYINNFVRMADYMLLEAIRESCYKAWKISDENVSSESSSIFNVELTFNKKGEVMFIPDKETLLKSVEDSLIDCIQTLENLPRLLYASDLQKMILAHSESPHTSLKEIFSCSTFLFDIKSNILKVIVNSYEEADQNSKPFCDYFPLFKLGKTWDVRNYIKTPSGELYKGPLNINERDESENHDAFLLNYAKEPIVDFTQLRSDIQRLRHEEKRVGDIRGGYVSGVLFIDTRPLKGNLTPIPLRSLTEIEATLKDLIQLKIDLMNRVFKTYSKYLKTESTTLEIFVEFCALLKKIQSLLPKMNSEISFVDDVVALCEEAKFGEQKNPLHDSYTQFKNEFQTALQVKKSHFDSYALELKHLVDNQHRKLKKYFNRSQLIPKSLKEFDAEGFASRTAILKKKIKKIKSTIHDCIAYQNVFETENSKFEEYKEAMKNIKISERLYDLFKLFETINTQVTKVPFNQINVDTFKVKCEELADQISNIDSVLGNRPCSIFREITNSFMEFSIFIEELSILSEGKMQLRHWNQLFEQCNQKDKYNNNITIDDLRSLQILENHDKIKAITEISIGEYNLEAEFKEIYTHWSEVHLPLADAQAKTEMTMLLAPLDTLLLEVQSTALTLNRILDNRFVEGIKEDVEKLAKIMDKIISIFKEWQIFQPNWIVVSALYQQEAIQNAVQKQLPKYTTVRRKWSSIVRHILLNTRLIAVCSYPPLLDDLHDNNIDLEIILKDLIVFADMKRKLIPRLYFLSDEELLILLSTNSFQEFTSHFTKTLMHVSRLENHSKDALELPSQDLTKEMCNFNGLTIFSIVGEDGDCLSLHKQIVCTGPIENWVPPLFKSIEESFKSSFRENLNLYEKSSLSDFVLTASSYIGILIHSIFFTTNVDECFSKVDSNARVFAIYEQELREKQNELINTLTSPLSANESAKLSNILVMVNMDIDRVHSFQDKIHGFSHRLAWNSTLKHRYNPNTDTLSCEILDYSVPHGYEYWGKCPNFIITPEFDPVISNLCGSIASGQIPMLYGPFATGKMSIIKYISMMFGHYFYTIQSFPDQTQYILNQLLTGAMECGSWIHFRDIHEMNIELVDFLFDRIRALTAAQLSKQSKFELEDENTSIYINQNTQFFMSRIVEGEIPAPLKSFTRPISLRAPTFSRLVELYLTTIGFKSSKHIAPKLTNFLNTTSALLNLPSSILMFSIRIIKCSYDVLMELVHTTRCPFINYYEEARTAEEFAIARGCYINMKYMIDDEQIEVLLQMIYANFTLFESFWMFKSYIQKPNCFIMDRMEMNIQQYLRRRIPEFGIDLPIEYLVSKTLDLFRLMQNHSIVAVCGPPNTGKSLIIQLLSESYQMLTKDPDFGQTKGVLPLKVAHCYHKSGSWEDIFGTQEYDPSSNNKWFTGEIHAALLHLSKFTKTHKRILHLDGHLDLKFSNFLMKAISDPSKISLTSRDTYPMNTTLHIVIESDNLYEIAPSFSSMCGILPMKSCQYFPAQLSTTAELDLMHPSIPFSSAALKFKSLLGESSIDLMRSLFCEYVPYILRQIHLMPAKVDLFSVVSSYTEMSACLALREIQESNISKGDNPDLFKISLVFSMFRVFSSILVKNQILPFDEFLRKMFSLNLPEEWVGYGLPNSYWDVFPTPSVLSMRVYNGRLNPHNFNSLSQPQTPTDDSITVLVPQFLPHLTTFNLGVQNQQHFLIHGERNTGKESFINVCLHRYKYLVPVHFYLTSCSSAHELRDILLHQSQITSTETRRLNDPTLFVLVFHHLDECKPEIFEFIRMLIDSKMLPVLSDVDSKVYDKYKLQKFIVMATGINISSFPPRFVALFTPLYMQEYTMHTKEYIVTKVMQKEEVANKFISLVNYSFREINLDIVKMLRIVKIICMMPEHKSSKDFVRQLNVFMSEVQFAAFSDDLEGFKNYQAAVLKVCQGFDLGPVFQQYRLEKKSFLPRITKKLDLVEVDIKALKDNLTQLSGRKFTDLETRQYTLVEHCVSKAKNHCELFGPTSSGKMSFVRLCSKKLGIGMIDMTSSSIEKLKNTLVHIILSNVQQIITMRVTDTTRETLDLLYTLVVYKHYKQLFTPDEVEELYRNVSKTERPTEIQRRDANIKIINTIENNCHLIIVTETLISLPLFEIIKLHSDTKEHICQEILSKDLITMQPLFCKIAEVLEKVVPYSHNNHFYDLLKAFDDTMKREQKNIVTRHEKITLALQFYEKITEDQRIAQNKIDQLQPSVAQLKEETFNLQEAFNQKHELVDEKKNKLNEEQIFKQAELNQKRKEYSTADVELRTFLPKFEAIKQKVRDFSDHDLQPLRIYCAAPTATVKQLSEVASIMSNRINDPKMFTDHDLPQILVEQIDYQTISEESIAKLQPFFDEETGIDVKQIETAPLALSIIYTYLQRTLRATQLNNTAIMKKQAVDANYKQLEEFTESMQKEMESIEAIESTFSEQSRELQQHQQKLQEMKSEYKQIKAEKRIIDQILKDSSALIDKWRQNSVEFQTLINTLNGDTITWVVYLIYAGMLPADKRIKMMDSVLDLLIHESVPISYTSPIEYVESRFSRMKLPVSTETSLPKPLLIDFYHLTNAVRVPLIIDIDGIVLHCLKSANNVVQVSLNALSFEKVIARSFQTDTYLALTDVDRLTPIISQIMAGEMILKFGNKEITRHPNFKLLLFTDKTRIKEFNADLLSRVTVIDTTSSSLEGVKNSIVHYFVDYFDSDLIPRVIQAEKSGISQQEEIMGFENATLDAFSFISKCEKENLDYSYLNDNETVAALCTAKDCYMAYTIQNESHNVKKELELAINQYLPLINVCYNCWRILTRYIRKVTPAIFRLQGFLETISTVLVNSGIHTLTSEQIQVLQASLLNSIYQLIFPSLSDDEILSFVFLTGFFYKGYEAYDLDQIIEHISNEFNGKAAFDNIDGETSLSAESLKYTSVDHFFQIIYKFACEIMGREFLNYMPSFYVDNAFSSQITILYSEGSKEPTELLGRFVSIRNLSEIFVTISLNKSTVIQTRKLIQKAMDKGLWIVINYSRASIDSSRLLNEIPSLITHFNEQKVHENFRLIINCRTVQYLSFELLETAKFIRIESFPSVKGNLQELYYHHAASLKVIDKSNIGKKIVYLSALIFAQIHFRSFLSPCGFNNISPPSIWSFHRIIDHVRRYTELPEFPIRNYRDDLENILLSPAVIESSDKQKLKQMVASFITSDSLDEGFNFLGSDSHESDRWIVGNETSIAGYSQFINKMPFFTNCDILGMNRQSAGKILEWNFSRYISRTFVKLYEDSQYEKEENLKQIEQDEHYRQRILHQIPIKITKSTIVYEITPMIQFWLNEANELNEFIEELNIDLTKNHIQIKEGVVPDKWQKFKSISQMSQFISFLNEKRAYIVKYIENSDVLGKEINITMISNPRDFFNAFLADYAYQKQIMVNTLYFDFTFGDGNEHQSIVITNLTMMNGCIVNGNLVPSDKPFNKLPKLFCKVAKRSTLAVKTGKLFNCPVYKFIFDKNMTSSDNFVMTNEYIENFVFNIPIPIDISEKNWILNGTSIYCNLPTQINP
ncbi:Dynein heavy chain family protein [Tritrichomonas foetus]|uniref:Dynein heavy chain family protein n=1 Tax=Tritrichomonas foetus TaxID=1144522 RepID=A0A1J4KP16_9EUKA|nr:Dynein heavy chain family protein [Tritrichomonas foetus]|eukprot:OHT11165.1 Dynein heavy chain family protein [Tritrichomonas foetus]